jgi:hypothetical protein
LVEVFSPDGECQHQLASLPVPQLINPVLVLLDGQIVTCGEYYDSHVNYLLAIDIFEEIFWQVSIISWFK